MKYLVGAISSKMVGVILTWFCFYADEVQHMAASENPALISAFKAGHALSVIFVIVSVVISVICFCLYFNIDLDEV